MKNISATVTHLVAVVLGVASTAVGATNAAGNANAKYLISGGIVTVVASTVAKLYHSAKVDEANIYHGVQVAEPELAKIISFVETEWPTTAPLINRMSADINVLKAWGHDLDAKVAPLIPTVIPAVAAPLPAPPAIVAPLPPSAPIA